MAMKRRSFIKSAIATGSMAILPTLALASAFKKPKRVVIIGGGFAGATAAKYLRMWGPDIEVVMIERNRQFVSCPQSNLVVGGSRTLQQLTHGYDELNSRYGVITVQAEVIAVDTEKQHVHLHDGVLVDYDRLIVAPGIDFIYDDLAMLASESARQRIPHAWKAGPQTQLLRDQLVSMRQGGVVLMTIPATPFRCPPGPYERACQIAFHLKHHNPTGKLIILDSNGGIVSKKALFQKAWSENYADLIEYHASSAIEDIDVKAMTVDSEFDHFAADVINVIPPQRAGKVAQLAGVINVDKRWCEVDFLTYESTVKPNVHIIGDAIASTLPKSGHVANAQAKVCAAAVIALLNEQQPEQQPVFNNTCYSFINDTQAGHVAAVYRYDVQQKQMLPMPGGGVSSQATAVEGRYANGWAHNLWADILE